LDRISGSWRVPLRHSRAQLDNLTIHAESAVPMMVDGLQMLLCRVRPGFDDFKDEQVELADEPGIDHLAFKVGEALGHQRRRHMLGWHLASGGVSRTCPRPAPSNYRYPRPWAPVPQLEWRLCIPSSPVMQQSCDWRCSRHKLPAAAQTRPSCARTSSSRWRDPYGLSSTEPSDA
jgi:hypothetical protein